MGVEPEAFDGEHPDANVDDQKVQLPEDAFVLT